MKSALLLNWLNAKADIQIKASSLVYKIYIKDSFPYSDSCLNMLFKIIIKPIYKLRIRD